ncbi:kinase-like domain-containing protein [Thelephora terrestris]|uniref:Kinase-like domain-containing protein n=1 Tax=Thelephora terrestris TaxID=56493 RepID=A0A9P6L3P9_9AGAM|nr:kinase-like domain-containing protein [Thelephora terrestris]
MFPKLIKAAAGPHDLGSGDNHQETLPELTVQWGSDSDTGYDSGGDSTTGYSDSGTDYGSNFQVTHNVSSEDEDAFDVVSTYVFENSNAEAVLIHHRDISRIRKGVTGTEMSEILSECQPSITVGSDGVGMIAHQNQHQLTDIEKRPVVDPAASSYLFAPNPTAVNMAQGRQNPTRQPSRPSSELSLGSSQSRPISPGASLQLGGNASFHPGLLKAARNTKLKPKRIFSNNVPPGLHYLPPDPNSEGFLNLFRSFLLSKDERTAILALSEEDAKVFIGIIASVLRELQLDKGLKTIAFSVLKKLCGRTGHLPSSYLLPDKFDLSGEPYNSGGFSNVWKVSKSGGITVAVKSLRISESDDKIRIRKRFCKEVVMWKNLSHPNVLTLIGVPVTLEEGRFSVASEWMVNGNIMDYVSAHAGNHLKLLADAVEGLNYLHLTTIVHGDLKGANILITNTNPVSACLADFGFMTIVDDTSLGMVSSRTEVDGETTPFMAPERLVPSKLGLDSRGSPTKEADIYAMAMVIYQVLTGTFPFGKKTGPEVVFQVMEGVKPPKPSNALELGLSKELWELLEECWQTKRQLRPQVKDVLSRVKSAASACGTLSPVAKQRQKDPNLDFTKFDQLFLEMTDGDQERVAGDSTARLSNHGSDVSLPDSLFSKLAGTSEATSLGMFNAVAKGGHSKEGSTEDLPAFLFETAPDHGCELETTYRIGHSKGENTEALSSFLFEPASDKCSRDNRTPQLSRPASVLSLYSSFSRPAEPDSASHSDGNSGTKPRESRFSFRRQFARMMDHIVDTKK